LPMAVAPASLCASPFCAARFLHAPKQQVLHNKPGLKTASKKSSLDPSNFLVVLIAGQARPLFCLCRAELLPADAVLPAAPQLSSSCMGRTELCGHLSWTCQHPAKRLWRTKRLQRPERCSSTPLSCLSSLHRAPSFSSSILCQVLLPSHTRAPSGPPSDVLVPVGMLRRSRWTAGWCSEGRVVLCCARHRIPAVEGARTAPIHRVWYMLLPWVLSACLPYSFVRALTFFCPPPSTLPSTRALFVYDSHVSADIGALLVHLISGAGCLGLPVCRPLH
jgi:hypothetical protein